MTDKRGFTMIELMMVMMLISILGNVAVSAFLDFRKEAYVAVLRQNLTTIRSGLKNQTQQAILRCGVTTTSLISYVDASGTPTGPTTTFNQALMFAAMSYNSITNSPAPVGYKICTDAQIPDPADRKFWNIDQSEYLQQYWNSLPSGSPLAIPSNPLVNLSTTANRISFVGSGVIPNRCTRVNGYIAGGSVHHWIFDLARGEVFPGTNTPGVNECNW